jgi:hypothetical protein
MILGKLKYSVGKEEGQVDIDWERMPTDVVLLDTLQDWIVELQAVYNVKMEEIYNRGELK